MSGLVSAIWRYPVKSMLGEALEAVALGPGGLLGDRGYAIRDLDTGHVASVKHPRKWRRLLECRATFLTEPRADLPLPPIVVTLPDGRHLASDDPALPRALSDLFGRAVELVSRAEAPTREANRAPPDAEPDTEAIRVEPMGLAAPGTFFDYAPVHVLSTRSLRTVSDMAPTSQFSVARFRPNLVIDTTSTAPFPEFEWLGDTVRIGGADLRMIDPAPRCVATTLPQPGLGADPAVLRTIARCPPVASVTAAPGVPFPAALGGYATVTGSGTIRRGDPLRVVRPTTPGDRSPA